ncbi:nuclear transport factor 2 family protein [Actinomadura montaniterrae]|uniref:nuclear transport factor 2 family protein n=1 Tax=Actinomadura montaniterrae TaxID=1803903 RepID=UPI001CEF85EB|nr:nuclear transport factor 2 family protein [Actinomadura montaniterrae]
MVERSIEQLADEFVVAVETGDLDAIRTSLYAPDAEIWHNTDGKVIGVEENLRVLGWLTGVLREMRYTGIQRRLTPDGYVQQHVLRGVVPNGDELTLRACFIVTVKDDRITRLDEYLDPAQSRCLDPYRPR